MTDLNALPAATRPNHKRWHIQCVSDTIVMRSGFWNGDHYEYGLAATGNAVEEVPEAYWWGTARGQAFILETADPGRYLFSYSHGVLNDTEMLVGSEIFIAFGFEPPQQTGSGAPAPVDAPLPAGDTK